MSTRAALITQLALSADLKQAAVLQRFFKTGPGEYGEGDVFLGIKVPLQRKIAKQFYALSLEDVAYLLGSTIHEHRFTALLLLIQRYQKANAEDKKALFHFYIDHIKQVNNWDLVDLSAPAIIGDYLCTMPKDMLYQLAESPRLWERRIAIIATFTFIKQHAFEDTLALAHILLNDQHDLIHKAVGWMLREVGKRDQAVEVAFLKKHAQRMPRTMLRYAIEKFDADIKKDYMKR